jgi:hypothetical protein
LLLAAGELGGEVIEALVQVDEPQCLPGGIGWSEISVTSPTFSTAVRLGMRL